MTEQDASQDLTSLESVIKGETQQAEEVGQEIVTNDPEPVEPKVEKAAPTAEGNESWTKTAVLDERRKRQELEQKLAAYEAQKPQAEVVNRPDVLEDQEGAFRHTETAIEGRILQERINLSRELMLDKHEDYEAMENIFVTMATNNPALVQEMNSSPNPAKFAYNKAKEHNEYLEFQKTKDSEDYRAFLEARKAGVFEKPVEETPAQKRNKSAVKVPDLINATSVKSGHIDGDKSLKQLLGR